MLLQGVWGFLEAKDQDIKLPARELVDDAGGCRARLSAVTF